MITTEQYEFALKHIKTLQSLPHPLGCFEQYELENLTNTVQMYEDEHLQEVISQHEQYESLEETH